MLERKYAETVQISFNSFSFWLHTMCTKKEMGIIIDKIGPWKIVHEIGYTDNKGIDLKTEKV